MHMLHLLRHAKSSWRQDVEDHDRPLTRRGRDAARSVGRALPTAIGRLDLVLCSSAKRTRETLDLVMSGFSPPPNSLVEKGLYLATAAKLLARLRQVDESETSVLVIGHNPGLHELAVALAGEASPAYRALADGKFPTAARASFRVETQWAILDRAACRLLDYALPGAEAED